MIILSLQEVKTLFSTPANQICCSTCKETKHEEKILLSLSLLLSSYSYPHSFSSHSYPHTFSSHSYSLTLSPLLSLHPHSFSSPLTPTLTAIRILFLSKLGANSGYCCIEDKEGDPHEKSSFQVQVQVWDRVHQFQFRCKYMQNTYLCTPNLVKTYRNRLHPIMQAPFNNSGNLVAWLLGYGRISNLSHLKQLKPLKSFFTMISQSSPVWCPEAIA